MPLKNFEKELWFRDQLCQGVVKERHALMFKDPEVDGTAMYFGKPGLFSPMSNLVTVRCAEQQVKDATLLYILAEAVSVLGYASLSRVFAFQLGRRGSVYCYIETFPSGIDSPEKVAGEYLDKIVKDLKLNR